MNKVIYFLFLTSMVFNLLGDGLNGWRQEIIPGVELSFTNRKITIEEYTLDSKYVFSKDFKTEYKEKNTYIDFFYDHQFSNGNESLNKYFTTGEKKWMILFDEGIMFAYEADDREPVFGGFLGRNAYLLMNGCTYSADSYLSEKNKSYLPNNLGIIRLSNPWVEGMAGDGIGSEIVISSNSEEKISGFLFSNGYVSYDKPYLYEYNSRVKKINIKSCGDSFIEFVEIKDTPNVQWIRLKQPTDKLILSIEEIYPGEKWQDTCINFLLPLI